MKKLTVVGIGAGNYDGLTVGAVKALENADVIVGYTVYCELIRPYFKNKEFVSTPMMRETERCRIALERASGGENTVMICSGDAGVYGMASPVLELGAEYDVEIEIVAGVTAALSGAALLGSPLTCDFAVISLSDLLTPFDVIEKRLDRAADADMCIVIYNPSSHKRADHLRRACEIILRHRSPETVCAVARMIGREGESSEILTLAELENRETDMFSTVFIGNSATKVINGRMVTPRGYRYE
ncbi:MAG: precorrin-3B C(17)-methyltransferase [Clostridia bacterium]|nr:precorrin-3B C(17)-methyltransferase [Clostridia bacterium]